MKQANALWQAVLDDQRLALDETGAPATRPPLGQRRRRGFDPAAADGLAAVSLMRDDEGLLRWMYEPPWQARQSGRRSWRSYGVDPSKAVQQFRFSELGNNTITQRLVDLDQRLTPGQGMQRWVGNALVADAQPKVSGRSLLLVHGTFSESEMFVKELQATAKGQQLAAQWQDPARYKAVLAFNHATLSVGAWSNAIDLARALRQVTGPIDVVCHSRGGLVVAWLLRLVPVPIERVVFVGSPLVGTSLAAPDRLRAALDLLANYADLTQQVGTAVSPVLPLASGVAALAKILGKVLHLGSELPVVDAALAMVPGLATQQHVANNLDLRQLFADDWLRLPQMHGIGVSFKPDESNEPLWKFWRRFTHLADQVKYAGADLVFDGPNDLVVDVSSMRQLGEKAVIPFKDLGTSPSTHHTNYFRDARVLDEIRTRLA